MTVPDRKLTKADFVTETELMNGITVIKTYVILTDGGRQPYEEKHKNEWGVSFYRKSWHFDGSVASIERHSAGVQSWRECDELLLYSYSKNEGGEFEDIYKYDILKGKCFQWTNGSLTNEWSPSLFD